MSKANKVTIRPLRNKGTGDLVTGDSITSDSVTSDSGDLITGDSITRDSVTSDSITSDSITRDTGTIHTGKIKLNFQSAAVSTGATDPETSENAPRRIGKAKAMPRAYRNPNYVRKRSKKYRESQQLNPQAKPAPKVKAKTPPRAPSKETILTAPSPASDFLDENGQYTIHKGRPPYVDPLSEGFDLMPDPVKKYSIVRQSQDCALIKGFYERSRGRDLDTLDRFKIYLELKEAFPYISKTRILRACGITPNREKELLQSMDRADPYEEVRPLIKKIYDESKGRAGRITIAAKLRKYGVYLCDQTVRRLMIDMNLKAVTSKGNPFRK